MFVPLPANASQQQATKKEASSASASSSGPAPPLAENLPLTGTARAQPSKGSKAKASSTCTSTSTTASDAMNGQNHLRQMRAGSHEFVPSPAVPGPPPQGGPYAQYYPQQQHHHQQQQGFQQQHQQQGSPYLQQQHQHQQQQHQQQQYHHHQQQYQQQPHHHQQQQQPYGGYSYRHPGMLNPRHPPPLPPLPPHSLPSFDPALIDAMRHEVDFVFSLENLSQDFTIAKHMRSGSIPVSKLLSLPRIKKLLASVNLLTGNGGGPERFLLAQAVARSKVVVLSEQEKKIGRRDHCTGGDLAWRCVVITNLSLDSIEASVKGLVSEYGEVARIKLGGEGGEEGEEGREGLKKAGRTAIVQFVSPGGALKCVDALGGAKSNWRVSRTVAYVNGYSVAQMTQILGVEAGEGGGGGGGGEGEGGEGGAATAAAAAATNCGASTSSVVKEGVSMALPPVIPEGEHTGVVLEVDGGGGAGAGRGVLKREGRRRTIISFQLPLSLVLAVGDRVAFSVKHVENKAVVQNVVLAPPLSSVPPPFLTCSSSSSSVSSGASSSSSSTGGGGSKVLKNGSTMAKGPDASLGFKLPRTKPPPELVELLEALKSGGGGKKEGRK